MVRRIKYRQITVEVPGEKPTQCEGCGRTIGNRIKKLDCHHWKYVYKTKEVKANPILALDNVSNLCFWDHKRIADPLRNLLEQDLKRVISVAKLMPNDMKKQFYTLLINLLTEI